MRERKKIGYLGGTFDPPHVGHLIIAKEALYQLDLDAVLWLITPDPPHKLTKEITPVPIRLDMLRLMLNKYSEFAVSEVDIQRSAPHYAADSVEILSQEQPNTDLVYIIGADSLQDLPGWYEPDRFLAAIEQLAVAPRPGYEPDLMALDRQISGLKEKIVFLNEVSLEISSRLIRNRIKQGAGYSHFLTEEVAAYIDQNQLYR
jgi:nicotinate-nucleotide adenylyltransferase